MILIYEISRVIPKALA